MRKKMESCDICGHDVAKNATFCPNCGGMPHVKQKMLLGALGDVPSVVEFDGSSGSWHSYAASSVASSFETSVRNARLSRGR